MKRDTYLFLRFWIKPVEEDKLCVYPKFFSIRSEKEIFLVRFLDGFMKQSQDPCSKFSSGGGGGWGWGLERQTNKMRQVGGEGMGVCSLGKF